MPARIPLREAASEKGPHDEPLGGPDQLHRVDQVAFRKDRQPDGVAQQDQRNDQQRAAEEQQYEAYLVHRGVQPLGHQRRVRHAVDAFDASGGGDERVEQLLVGGCRREREFERIQQRVLRQDLLERTAEHLAELLLLGFLLLGGVGDRRDHLLGGQAFADGLFLRLRKPVLQLHGDGDALLERVGDLQRRDHQVTHRSQQEQHERDAHRRHDVGVADLSLQSFIVFHGVCRDNGKFRASLVAANRK